MVELRLEHLGLSGHQTKDHSILTVLHTPKVEMRQRRPNSVCNSQEKPKQSTANSGKTSCSPLWHLELVGSPSSFIVNQFFCLRLRRNKCFSDFLSAPAPTPATPPSRGDVWILSLILRLRGWCCGCFHSGRQDSQQSWAKKRSTSFQHEIFRIFHWSPTSRYDSKWVGSIIHPVWTFWSMNVLPRSNELVNVLPPKIDCLCDAGIILLEGMFSKVFWRFWCFLKKWVYELQLLPNKNVVLMQQAVAIDVKHRSHVFIASSNGTFDLLSSRCLVGASICSIAKHEDGMRSKLSTPLAVTVDIPKQWSVLARPFDLGVTDH